MKIKSLFWKNFIIYAGILLAVFLMFGSAFIMQVDRYAATEKQQTLERSAGRVAEITSLFLDNYSSFMMKVYQVNLSQLASDSGVYIIVCDERGRIAYLIDSDGTMKPTTEKVSEETVKAAVRAGNYSGITTMEGLFSRSMFAVGLPLQSKDGDFIGVAFTLSPADETIKLLRDIIEVFLIGVVASLGVALAVSSYVTARMVRPLKNMAAAAKKFAGGDFSARVQVEPGRMDEVTELAVSFNNMAASLEDLEEQRRGFMANVSHDLKTPMTTIAGFVDGMLDGTITEEKRENCLHIISDEVKRLSRLATRMLEASRFESGGIVLNKTVFDVCEMASRIILNFEKTLNDRAIDVEIDFPDQLMITADRDTLFQAIYNLVDNAVKFVGEAGILRMKIAASGGNMVFTLTNSGPPIAPEDMPYLFDRFYKADRSRALNRQGSGLGLYIAKTAISLHGGEISARSEGEMTTFEFKIPING